MRNTTGAMTGIKRWLAGFFIVVGYNSLTLFGATLVTFAAGAIVLLLILGAVGVAKSAYLGILTFLVFPVVFVAGLLIIPLGVLWQRSHGGLSIKDGLAGPYPVLDFNKRHVRSVVEAIAVLTFVNILIISVVAYEGVHYTESVPFCGQVCHEVMEPEFAAYSDSPHSRVACVKCHIGPGASWFVKSKLSGVRQVFAVLFDTYARPIDTPVKNLRPSTDTCEQCHQPDKFTGDRLRVIPKYMEDDENTKVFNLLLMHIGGGHGEGKGIHSWHIAPGRKTEYLATDEDRQVIPYVRVTEADGRVLSFVSQDSELTEDEIANAELRQMDCIDCHNRPTHIYEMPGPAIDKRMDQGLIDPSLPGIKMAGREALERAGAEDGDIGMIAEIIRAHFKEDFPEILEKRAKDVDQAIATLEAIYRRNVFPDMKLTWGSYINNLGHEVFDGCFRCHDDGHATKSGEVIRQDCDLCHAMLAWEEEDPAVLADLGIE